MDCSRSFARMGVNRKPLLQWRFPRYSCPTPLSAQALSLIVAPLHVATTLAGFLLRPAQNSPVSSGLDSGDEPSRYFHRRDAGATREAGGRITCDEEADHAVTLQDLPGQAAAWGPAA